jgi:hypothetical protein
MIFGEFLREVKMGVRLRKKSQSKRREKREKNNGGVREKLKETGEEKVKQEVLVVDKKNGTIAEIDFFGFSPSLFWSDLHRTAWGTGVMVVVLVVVYLMVR